MTFRMQTQPRLTSRQTDVLKLLVSGMTNEMIADHLGLAPSTVKDHLSAIYRTLDVHNRTQAAYVALQRGLA
jgi:two-component system, NarL family, nitrate/nitrite response regulator NarL